MNKLVEEYLNKKAKEIADAEQKKKEELLNDLDLYEKEYSPDNEYSPEYPVSEYDLENGTTRYYRRKPIEVSDEEYAEILKYQKESERAEIKGNSISGIFTALGWIVFFGGFIAGILLGQVKVGYDTVFVFSTALVCWIASFVCGMTLLGFAEIIKLLHEINSKK